MEGQTLTVLSLLCKYHTVASSVSHATLKEDSQSMEQGEVGLQLLRARDRNEGIVEAGSKSFHPQIPSHSAVVS